MLAAFYYATCVTRLTVLCGCVSAHNVRCCSLGAPERLLCVSVLQLLLAGGLSFLAAALASC
jgi:hypothetical protein